MLQWVKNEKLRCVLKIKLWENAKDKTYSSAFFKTLYLRKKCKINLVSYEIQADSWDVLLFLKHLNVEIEK